MAGDQREGDTNGAGESGKQLPLPTHDRPMTSAERKRLSARRRFLVGGAVSMPLIVSVSRKAFADDGWDWDDGGKKKGKGAGRSMCVTIAMKKKKKISKKGDKKGGKKGGKKTKKGKKSFVSLVCKSKTKKV